MNSKPPLLCTIQKTGWEWKRRYGRRLIPTCAQTQELALILSTIAWKNWASESLKTSKVHKLRHNASGKCVKNLRWNMRLIWNHHFSQFNMNFFVFLHPVSFSPSLKTFSFRPAKLPPRKMISFWGAARLLFPIVDGNNKFYFPRVNDKIMTFKNIILWLTYFTFLSGSRDFLTIKLFMALGDAFFGGKLLKREFFIVNGDVKIEFPSLSDFLLFQRMVSVYNSSSRREWFQQIMWTASHRFIMAIVTRRTYFFCLLLYNVIKMGFAGNRKSFSVKIIPSFFACFILLFFCLHYK